MRIVGVPEKDAGLLGRFAYWFSQRRFGKVPEPVRVTAHHRKVLLGTGAMELALDRSDLANVLMATVAINTWNRIGWRPAWCRGTLPVDGRRVCFLATQTYPTAAARRVWCTKAGVLKVRD